MKQNVQISAYHYMCLANIYIHPCNQTYNQDIKYFHYCLHLFNELLKLITIHQVFSDFGHIIGTEKMHCIVNATKFPKSQIFAIIK